MDGDLARIPEIESVKRSMFIPDNRNVVLLWPQIEKWIGPLIEEEGLYDPIDILMCHLRNERFIFVGWNDSEKSVDFVIVAQPLTFPKKKVCVFQYVAGKDLRAWTPFYLNVCEDFAKKAGCKLGRGAGRPGWERLVGYKRMGVLSIKELV